MPVHGPTGGRYRLMAKGPAETEWRHFGWYDTKEELDAWIDFAKAVPLDDGPIQLRVQEYGLSRDERV